jgi:hypothetical protein
MKSNCIVVFPFLLGVFVLLFPSCETGEMSDFKHGYIKITLLNQEIKTDTLSMARGSSQLLTVTSQSNISSKPRFYKKTGAEDIVNVTVSDENFLVSQTYGSGYREVRNIAINLNDDAYMNVLMVTYLIQIGDKEKGQISREIVVLIE